MKTFEQELRVRLCHCDPAGIMFHPQYFVILNGVMEDFFRDVAGLSFEKSIRSGHGFPIVSVAGEFPNPTFMGEMVRVAMTVESIGESSVTFAFEMTGADGSVRMLAREVAVSVRKTREGIESTPIPDDIRAVFEAYKRNEPLQMGPGRK